MCGLLESLRVLYFSLFLRSVLTKIVAGLYCLYCLKELCFCGPIATVLRTVVKTIKAGVAVRAG